MRQPILCAGIGLARLSSNLAAVDPTIAAAWITGGVGALGIAGTVATAIVGSRSTRKATEATVAAGTASNKATLVAARDDRLWEKRCVAYEDMIGTLLRRQKKRQTEMTREVLGIPIETDDDGWPVTDEPPVSFEDQARLLAYASDEVRDAFEATRQADSDLGICRAKWVVLVEEARGEVPFVQRKLNTREAYAEVRRTRSDAEERDQALISLIRRELRSHPGSAIAPG